MIGILKLVALTTAECNKEPNLLGFPSWHRNLQKVADPGGGSCTVMINKFSDTWVVVANIADILIRVAGLLAVGFIIYGGIRYIISQGEPDNLQAAKRIITNAIAGLVIAILASTIVGFIAGQF